MNRRGILLAASSWLAFARVGAALGQSKQAPILIGCLAVGSRESDGHYRAAFKEGFAALGWKEGSDFRLEERWADGDPLATGLVTSLARPGGMITGLSNVIGDTNEKLLELLLAAAPKLRRIGLLADPTSAVYRANVRAAQRAIGRHRVEARFAEAARPEDLEPAISRLAKDGAQALILLSSSWFGAERQRVVSLVRAHRWPLVPGLRKFAKEGALLSYGADRAALYRRAAYYVDRILKGMKPGDLPIEQPTKFDLVINLKSAKALGLTIPPLLLLRADEVIQ